MMKTKSRSALVPVLILILSGCTSTVRPEYRASRTADSAALLGSAQRSAGIHAYIIEVDGALVRQDRQEGWKTPVYVEPGEHFVMVYVTSGDKRAHPIFRLQVEPRQIYHFVVENDGLDFVVSAWRGEPASPDKSLVSRMKVPGESNFGAPFADRKAS